MVNESQLLDAIEALMLSNAWTTPKRRDFVKVHGEVRIADYEGRLRRALRIEATSPTETAAMRRHIYDLLDEARREALKERGESGSISAGAAVTAIVKMGELYGCFPKTDVKEQPAEMKTLADKRRVAVEARAALQALEEDIAAEEAGRH